MSALIMTINTANAHPKLIGRRRGGCLGGIGGAPLSVANIGTSGPVSMIHTVQALRQT